MSHSVIYTMKLIFVLLVCAQIALASQEWENFKIKYGKNYKSEEEEEFRKQIFLDKLKSIEEHNKKYEQRLSTYKTGINKLSDLLKSEIFPAADFNSQIVVGPSRKKDNYKISPREEVPDSIDWRDYGVISPVADQLMCNSCWAFAVVATVEAHWAIYKQQNVTLSQQNLVDCVDSTFTCQDYMDRDILEKTYEYIIDNGGIDTREFYPNIYYVVAPCTFSSDYVGATITSYANVTDGDEEELKRIVGTIGPVTVAITTSYYFDAYTGGVFYEEDCMSEGADIFNHAVAIVGYGTEDGQDYWLVKNSWGTWFGDQGYIKMARNRDNNCGIASIARYPII